MRCRFFCALLLLLMSDGIWRWDGYNGHIEIQDVVRNRDGNRLSEDNTQRLFSMAATGSNFLAPGIWYVPFTVQGSDLCVLRFVITYDCNILSTDFPKSGNGPFGMSCGRESGYVSGVRTLAKGGRSLKDATAVVAVTGNRGNLPLRWIGGSK
jgi:hypothetical protein